MYHLQKGSQYYAINNMEGNVMSANTGKIIINVSNCIKPNRFKSHSTNIYGRFT